MDIAAMKSVEKDSWLVRIDLTEQIELVELTERTERTEPAEERLDSDRNKKDLTTGASSQSPPIYRSTNGKNSTVTEESTTHIHSHASARRCLYSDYRNTPNNTDTSESQGLSY